MKGLYIRSRLAAGSGTLFGFEPPSGRPDGAAEVER